MLEKSIKDLMPQAHMIRFDLQDVGHGDALTVKTTKTTAVCGLVKSSLSMTATTPSRDAKFTIFF